MAVAVTRSRLLDVGAGEAQHSRLAADPPRASGGRFPRLKPSSEEARFIAWHLRHLFFMRIPTGPVAFFDLPACLGNGPALGPTSKKPLYHTRPVSRTYDK